MCGILCMIVLVVVVFGVVGNVLVEDWKLVKDEDGVKVYFSSVQGFKYKVYCGVIDIKVDVVIIEVLQEDVKGFCKWIYVCVEMKFLKQEGVDVWIYLKIDMFWLVIGCDVVIYVIIEKIVDGIVICYFKVDLIYIFEEKGQICVFKLVGEWKLQLKGQGVMEVIYQVEIELGGSIFFWLVNSFVVDVLLNIFKGLCSVVEKC